jgi:hypothetical protein
MGALACLLAGLQVGRSLQCNTGNALHGPSRRPLHIPGKMTLLTGYDVRFLGKKIQRQYAQCLPLAPRKPIQPACKAESVKQGQRNGQKATGRTMGVWLPARNDCSISRVQRRSAASVQLALT